MREGIEILSAVLDFAVFVFLILIAIILLRRTRGREHRMILVGVILWAAALLFYVIGLVSGSFTSTYIVGLLDSVSSLFLFLGIWLFVRKVQPIRTVQNHESNQSVQTRTTSGPV